MPTVKLHPPPLLRRCSTEEDRKEGRFEGDKRERGCYRKDFNHSQMLLESVRDTERRME